MGSAKTHVDTSADMPTATREWFLTVCGVMASLVTSAIVSDVRTQETRTRFVDLCGQAGLVGENSTVAACEELWPLVADVDFYDLCPVLKWIMVAGLVVMLTQMTKDMAHVRHFGVHALDDASNTVHPFETGSANSV